jgi:signal transduction histidine kinase
VEVDRHLIASALANLVQNGIKFTPPKGSVTVSVRLKGDRVLIEVSDECGGLPAGKADSLFRAYVQTHRDRSGLGLGLALARQSVEANGGLLRVQDIPGTGCVFTVDLPSVAPPAPQ